jgi:hypothetical protein
MSDMGGCLCGCGGIPNKGKKYITHHNFKDFHWREYPPELSKQMRDLYKSGCSVAYIAKRFGKKISPISKMLKRNGYIVKFGIRENHPNWKGGVVISRGYRMILVGKEHPRSDRWGRIAEHIFIMEKHLGRYLTNDERVHHIDLDKINNDISNLYLSINVSAHGKIHSSLNKIVNKLIKDNVIGFSNGAYYLKEEGKCLEPLI